MQYDAHYSDPIHNNPHNHNHNPQPNGTPDLYGDDDTRIHDGGRLAHRGGGWDGWQPTEDGPMHDGQRTSYRSVIWMALGGMVVLSGVFALGVAVGRRSERMDAAPALDPIAHVNVETDHHDNLMFYQTLTQPPVAPKVGGMVAQPAPPAPMPALASGSVAKAAVSPSKGPSNTEGETSRVKALPALAKSNAGGKDVAKEVHKELGKDAGKFKKLPNNRIARALHATGPAKPGEFTMQLGAFQSLDDATAMVVSLQKQGFSPYVVSAKVAGKGVWHRVRLGRFTDQQTAQEGKHVLQRSAIAALVLKAD